MIKMMVIPLHRKSQARKKNNWNGQVSYCINRTSPTVFSINRLSNKYKSFVKVLIGMAFYYQKFRFREKFTPFIFGKKQSCLSYFQLNNLAIFECFPINCQAI